MLKLVLISLIGLVVVALVVSLLAWFLADEMKRVMRRMDDPKHWEKQLEEAKKAVAEAEGHLTRLRPQTEPRI